MYWIITGLCNLSPKNGGKHMKTLESYPLIQTYSFHDIPSFFIIFRASITILSIIFGGSLVFAFPMICHWGLQVLWPSYTSWTTNQEILLGKWGSGCLVPLCLLVFGCFCWSERLLQCCSPAMFFVVFFQFYCDKILESDCFPWDSIDP